MFFWVVSIEETGCSADHIDAEPTIEIFFSLVIGPNSHTNLNTHCMSSKCYILITKSDDLIYFYFAISLTCKLVK